MEKEEVISTLEDLRENIAYLAGEEVDDPEEILTDLGIGSEEYVKALDFCLDVLRGKHG